MEDVDELEEVKRRIRKAEADLEKAQERGNEELELKYSGILDSLLREKERLQHLQGRPAVGPAGGAAAGPAGDSVEVLEDNSAQHLKRITLPFGKRLESLVQEARVAKTVEEGLDSVFRKGVPSSCTCIYTRVVHGFASVRTTIVRDLLNMGVAHGYIRRINPSELDVLIVARNPVDPSAVVMVASYFLNKWGVEKEQFRVDQQNYLELNRCKEGFFIYRSAFPDDNSADDDIDLISADGYTVKSEVSNPTRLVFPSDSSTK